MLQVQRPCESPSAEYNSKDTTAAIVAMEISPLEQLTEAQHRIAELEAELAVKQHQLAAQERINQLAATLAAREQHHPPPNGRAVTRDFLVQSLPHLIGRSGFCCSALRWPKLMEALAAE